MKADDQYHINNLWWYHMQHKAFIIVHFLDKFRIFITLSVEANHCKISDTNAKSFCETIWLDKIVFAQHIELNEIPTLVDFFISDSAY